MITLGVVGYRNHARRIVGLADEEPGVGEIIVYHPDWDRLGNANLSGVGKPVHLTDDLDRLRDADAVAIVSPTPTHVPYIRELMDSGVYIFCEKPPASTAEDLAWLQGLPPGKRERVQFNFSYVFTPLAETARHWIDDGAHGAPQHFTFLATHGLAFRTGFREDWRAGAADHLSSIVGNLGIHYLHLCMWLLGPPDEVGVHASAWSPQTQSHDTASIHLRFGTGATADVFLSYASPFIADAKLVFTDGYLAWDGTTVRAFNPRDTFDADGRFAPPPARELSRRASAKAEFDSALARSLGFFVATVAAEGGFDSNAYDLALESTRVLLKNFVPSPMPKPGSQSREGS